MTQAKIPQKSKVLTGMIHHHQQLKRLFNNKENLKNIENLKNLIKPHTIKSKPSNQPLGNTIRIDLQQREINTLKEIIFDLEDRILKLEENQRNQEKVI